MVVVVVVVCVSSSSSSSSVWCVVCGVWCVCGSGGWW